MKQENELNLKSEDVGGKKLGDEVSIPPIRFIEIVELSAAEVFEQMQTEKDRSQTQFS